MRGGFRGPTTSSGGLGRTYGLDRHFTKEPHDGPPTTVDREYLRRISGYFRPYWKQWALTLCCITVSAGLGVLPPFCVGMILDKAIPAEDLRLLGLLAFAMVGLTIAVGLIGVLQQTLTAHAGQRIMFDLRNQLYRHLQRMSLGFFVRTRSGEIISRINNDVSAVQSVALGTIVAIVGNVAVLTAACIALFTRSWRLALLAIVIVPAFYLPSKLVGGIRRKLATDMQESQAGLLAFLTERLHVGGAILTQGFGQREEEAYTFAEHNARVRDLAVQQTVVGRWLRMILMMFSAVGPALVYWYGGYQVIHDELTPGMLVAFAALLGQLYRPLIQLGSVYGDIQAALAVFDRIFDYLDMHPEVSDSPEALHLEKTSGHLVVEGVCFAYPHARAETETAAPKQTFALQDVSFEIAPGEQVALVGPSGAGKTTLTYLVPRFYDPTDGRILLDGQDVRDLAQESLRSHIAMVTQETFLFHASLRENLVYARPTATPEELEDACRAAAIHDFIAALPAGYDTVVGERGFRLSGGEKQRVSIARALLKDPAILILDEATSNLDATSESLIQVALERLLEGRTSLVIAHRLSTILRSDRIVVIAAGRVEQMGTHHDLIAQGGLYATLFEQQFGHVLEMSAGR